MSDVAGVRKDMSGLRNRTRDGLCFPFKLFGYLLHTSLLKSVVDVLLDDLSQILVLSTIDKGTSLLNSKLVRFVTRVAKHYDNVVVPLLQILWQSDAGLSISNEEIIGEGPVKVVSTLAGFGDETEFDDTSVVGCLRGLV